MEGGATTRGLNPPTYSILDGTLYRLPTNFLILARIAYINLIPFDIPLYILWARPSPKFQSGLKRGGVAFFGRSQKI